MKHGIYYSYWEHEWSAKFGPYIEKVAKLGFDIIEVAAHHINEYSDAELATIRQSARITASCSLPDRSVQNEEPVVRDASVRAAGKAFLSEPFPMSPSSISAPSAGHCTPIGQSIIRSRRQGRRLCARRRRHQRIADFANDLGINLCIEVLNRFENHVLNTAAEGVAFVKDVGKNNVKVMLDTFHMNIEEDSFGEAIRTAGPLLGHFHTGEKQSPRSRQGQDPWHEIGQALREINYSGAVVMEPFVKTGGTIGSDIKVWRDLSEGADIAKMDEDARNSLAFSRFVLGG